MKITIQYDQQFFCYEISYSQTIQNLKALLEVDTKIPIEQQSLFFQDQPLINSITLQASGIVSDTMLNLVKIVKRNLTQTFQSLLGQPRSNYSNPFFSSPQPSIQQEQKEQYINELANQQLGIIKEKIRSNKYAIQMMKQRTPQLGLAMESNNDEAALKYLRNSYRQKIKEYYEKKKRIQSLYTDQMNPETQKALEEELHKQRVQENKDYAQEYFPEFFGQISMLYVEMQVNKKPIQALVDSGAQSTIMSESLAEMLGLMKLVDRQYVGIVQGVGTSKIVGRIHAAEVMIGGRHFACSFIVLEDNKIDFLFGLDNLKRHQCCIDLAQNKLILDGGNVAVPFLPQNQILPNELLQQKLISQASKPKVQQQKKHDELPKKSQQKQQTQKKIDQDDTNIQGYPQSIVLKLMDLGFNMEQVIRALNQAMGNDQIAASILFQQQ